MLHAIALFCTLGIVEPIERANQIARNTTNALEARTRLVVMKLDIISIRMGLNAAYLRMLLLRTRHISGCLFGGKFGIALEYDTINVLLHFYSNHYI